MSIFKKPPKPTPPPTTPTRADSSVLTAGEQARVGFPSLISSGAAVGLTRKARTVKPALIGGA